MTFLTQTKLHDPPESIGNCWVTCISCILGLSESPELNALDDDFWEQSEALANKHGKTLIEFKLPMHNIVRVPEGCIYILSGVSPRDSTINHAVVGKIIDGKHTVLHDPHPSRSGITTHDYATFFLDQTKFTTPSNATSS